MYDGDMCSFNFILSREANEENKRLNNTKQAILSAGGKLALEAENDIVKRAVLALTKPANDIVYKRERVA